VLVEIHIENFAIIDRLNISFKDGLNVITGETGAGKSILIGAIQLLIGGKGSIELIRESEESAEVEGLFDISKYPLIQEIVENAGFGKSDTVLLKRILSRTGRSKAYINGRLASLSILERIGEELINIYGQHEHQTLLRPESHIDLLDAFSNLLDKRNKLSHLLSEWERLVSEEDEIKKEIKRIEEQRELWEFQLKEIEGAKLRDGEDSELKMEFQILTNAEKIMHYCSEIEERLYSGTESAYEKIGQVRQYLKEMTKIDPDLHNNEEVVKAILFQIDELVQFLRNYLKKVMPDPVRLVEVEGRIAEIQRLKRKYGNTIKDIINYGENLRNQLNQCNDLGNKKYEIEVRIEELEKRIGKEAIHLSLIRRDASVKLSSLIEKELAGLGMAKPTFRVMIDYISNLQAGRTIKVEGHPIGPKGIDRVEFYLSTNEGESPKPLSKIASGGELSRIMLALKKVLAGAIGVPTLIFDEIDAGIGGSVAQIVGEKLKSISKDHQVFCVTHLPQIACYANAHFRVQKEIKSGRTLTVIEPLSEDERVEEIARMLGGLEITEKTKEHAMEMISMIRR
jgi:DNA repair protein RecN (Recombination protein N)